MVARMDCFTGGLLRVHKVLSRLDLDLSHFIY